MAGAVSEVRAKFSATINGFKQGIAKVKDDIQGMAKDTTKANKQMSDAFRMSHSSLLLLAGAGAGLATIGAGIAGAVTITEDYQKALNGVTAQTGATEEETKALGESMKNIYANNYGADFTDIGDALALTATNTGLAGKELEAMTQNGIALRDTFQYDIAESTKVADTMMKQFGISGEEAYELIAQGAQSGMDKSGDMLDTFNEYSVYFKQLGFDSEGMWNVINAGMDSGAFNADKVGDSIKELGIRVKDGSKGTTEAFEALGLNADQTAKAFAKGGESSQEALQTIFRELGAIEDPVKRNTIGVSLFGTQFEDLEHKTIMAMGSVQEEANKSGNSLDKINEVKFNTVGEAIQGIRRSLEVEVIEPMQTKVMPAINGMINGVRKNLPALKDAFSQAFNAILDTVNKFRPTFESLFTIFKNVGGWLGSTLVVAFSALGSIMAPIVNTITSIVAGFTSWEGFIPVLNGIIAGILAYKTYLLATKIPLIASTLLTNGLAMATRLLNIAMSMNPIGLIIALLVALGVALYTAYQKSETFRNIVNGVWDAIKAGAKFVFEWLVTNIPIWIENIKNFFIGLGTSLSNIWSTTVEGAKAIWSGLVAFFTGIVTGIKNIWNTVSTFFSNLWLNIVSVVKPIIDNFVNGIVTGFTNFVTNLMYIVSPIITFFKNTWENIKLIVLGIIGAFLNLITGNMEGFKISLLAIWTGIKNQITNIITTLKEVAIRIFNLWLNGVKKIFETLMNIAITIVNTLKNGVINGANALKDGALKAFQALKNGAINTWNNLKSGVINAVNSLKNGAINAVNALKSGFVNTVNNIKSAVTNGFNNAKTTAINAINGMKTGVSNAINNIKTFFSNMKENIISTIKGINLRTLGVNMVQGLIDGISGMVGKVWNKITELANGITDKIKGILDIHSPSRIFRSIGGFIGQGLSIGIDKSRKLVEKTTEALAQSAMIDPDTVGIGSLTDDEINDQLPDDPNAPRGNGGGSTTNYQAPLMQVDNMYVNDRTDAREVSHGLYRLQQDHDRSKGDKTS